MSDVDAIVKAKKKQRQGAVANSFGKLFERLFDLGCRRIKSFQVVAITRMPDGCRVVGRNKLMRVKTPFDWIVTFNGLSVFVDTKTTLEDSFAHSKIEPHQVNEMAKHEAAGTRAGYVIWLRKTDVVFYIGACALQTLMKTRGSIEPSNPNCITLGSSNRMDVTLIWSHPDGSPRT